MCIRDRYRDRIDRIGITNKTMESKNSINASSLKIQPALNIQTFDVTKYELHDIKSWVLALHDAYTNNIYVYLSYYGDRKGGIDMNWLLNFNYSTHPLIVNDLKLHPIHFNDRGIVDPDAIQICKMVVTTKNSNHFVFAVLMSVLRPILLNIISQYSIGEPVAILASAVDPSQTVGILHKLSNSASNTTVFNYVTYKASQGDGIIMQAFAQHCVEAKEEIPAGGIVILDSRQADGVDMIIPEVGARSSIKKISTTLERFRIDVHSSVKGRSVKLVASNSNQRLSISINLPHGASSALIGDIPVMPILISVGALILVVSIVAFACYNKKRTQKSGATEPLVSYIDQTGQVITPSPKGIPTETP
eukprot:TRINITY_DN1693_c0_g1_i3.p1 TRINITY_DN1693_c0_g1~~TRINITY_DN1693_c0_g1_i3.p1  ORF type:complete len:394 (-),score=69.47 TRINITY_DN1693_c0_g1_i3:1230-2315(-)